MHQARHLTQQQRLAPGQRAQSLRSARPSRGSAFVVLAAAQRKQLPIFPLNVVALPSSTVPLMIFEARYRVLFSTLLKGGEGVEEGLIQHDSPFCGSKRFGMCYMDQEGRLAAVGTALDIVDFTHVQDGRILVTSKGRERFRIVEVVKEKPVLICEVEELPPGEDADTEEVRELAKEVADLLRSTIRLSVKMNSAAAASVAEDQLEPEELADLGPRDLSFWVASFFSDVKLLQQNLLEEDSTLKRLQKEKEILSETVRYYSAASALKMAFSPSSSGSGSSGSGDLDKPAEST